MSSGTLTGEAHETAPATLGAVLGARQRDVRGTPEAMWVGLVHAMAAGEEGALREFYGRLHPLVFTLTLRIVRDRQCAEELTLDVFHAVWRRASDYHESGGTVIGWVMNQARSRAIDRLRFDNRKKRTPSVDQIEPSLAGSTEDAVDEGLRERVVRNALIHLTVEERQAIESAYFADRTYVKVAETLGVPAGTIKTRIRSGLMKLRRVLAEEGATR